MNDTEPELLAVATAAVTVCSAEWKCVNDDSTAATALASVKYLLVPSDRSDVDLLARLRFEPVALETKFVADVIASASAWSAYA